MHESSLKSSWDMNENECRDRTRAPRRMRTSSLTPAEIAERADNMPAHPRPLLPFGRISKQLFPRSANCCPGTNATVVDERGRPAQNAARPRRQPCRVCELPRQADVGCRESHRLTANQSRTRCTAWRAPVPLLPCPSSTRHRESAVELEAHRQFGASAIPAAGTDHDFGCQLRDQRKPEAGAWGVGSRPHAEAGIAHVNAQVAVRFASFELDVARLGVVAIGVYDGVGDRFADAQQDRCDQDIVDAVALRKLARRAPRLTDRFRSRWKPPLRRHGL